MSVFDACLNDKTYKFKIKKNTKNFVVGFFGFYPNSLSSKFFRFLLETEIKDVATEGGNKDGFKTEHFLLNGDYGLETYNTYDRRTFDLAIILPKTFSNQREAEEWFDLKLKESKCLCKRDINQIKVFDADKLMNYVNKFKEQKKLIQEVNQEFNKSIEHCRQLMLAKFSNNKEISKKINNKINSMITTEFLSRKDI